MAITFLSSWDDGKKNSFSDKLMALRFTCSDQTHTLSQWVITEKEASPVIITIVHLNHLDLFIFLINLIYCFLILWGFIAVDS